VEKPALEQLEILGQELSGVTSTLKKLKERESVLRAQALEVMKKLSDKKSVNTKYGRFTLQNGRKTKVITCRKYLAAKKELEVLELQAIQDKKFKIVEGDNSLKFCGIEPS
jgi:hypothetical protein